LALLGEWDGLLWCMDLDGGRAIRWTCRASGAVRRIARTRNEGVHHFLVGAESGALALLRAEDGRRFWRNQLPQAICQLAILDGDKLAVGMRLGLVALYHRLELEERQQVLAEVRVGTEALASVPPEAHPGIWDTGNGPRVEAFFRLLRGGGDIPGLFRRFQDREPRARLLRYLAQEYDGLPDQAEAIILKALSFWDLINLMAYLPDELDEWDRLIRADLG